MPQIDRGQGGFSLIAGDVHYNAHVDPKGKFNVPSSAGSDCSDPLAAKKDLVRQLLEIKQASGKTYTKIAKEVGLTNLYTAQLFQNQVINLAALCNNVSTFLADY